MEDDISQNFLEIFTIVWLNDILSYLKYKDHKLYGLLPLSINLNTMHSVIYDVEWSFAVMNHWKISH